MNQIINATYHDEKLTEYIGNPMIEAIPRSLSKPEFESNVKRRLPEFKDSSDIGDDDCLDRIEFIQNCHYPLPDAYQLYKKIVRVIRHGYTRRNPLTPDFKRYLEDLATGNKPDTTFIETSVKAISIIGNTRTGKSTTIKHCLNAIPQIIKHDDIDRNFKAVQITWLSFDCPNTKTSKGLILSLLLSLDRAISTSYFGEYARTKLSVQSLVEKAEIILKTHNVGIIHIDEMQNVKAYEGNDIASFAFFDTFFNQIGIPIIWSSTPSIISTIQSSMTTQCRLFKDRTFTFEAFEKGGSNWTHFVKYFYYPDLLSIPFEFDDEFIDIAHELTVGLPGIFSRIIASFYEMAIEAHYTSEEFNATTHLIAVYYSQFPALHTALEALRNGNEAAYNDLLADESREILTPLNNLRSLELSKETISRSTDRNQTLISENDEEKLFEKVKNIDEWNSFKTNNELIERKPLTIDAGGEDLRNLADLGESELSERLRRDT